MSESLYNLSLPTSIALPIGHVRNHLALSLAAAKIKRYNSLIETVKGSRICIINVR